MNLTCKLYIKKNVRILLTITLWVGMVGSLYSDQSFGSMTVTGIS